MLQLVHFISASMVLSGRLGTGLEDRDRREKEVQKMIPGYKEVPYGPKW
ncbi:hypothetical protein IR022_19190 [Dysgonomonas sp. GY617]|nr:hypothetical protein [Dysgonomonas sp. GY617]